MALKLIFSTATVLLRVSGSKCPGDGNSRYYRKLVIGAALLGAVLQFGIISEGAAQGTLYTASWCGPCNQLKAANGGVSGLNKLGIKVVDIDANPELFSGGSIPHLSMNGKEITGKPGIEAEIKKLKGSEGGDNKPDSSGGGNETHNKKQKVETPKPEEGTCSNGTCPGGSGGGCNGGSCSGGRGGGSGPFGGGGIGGLLGGQLGQMGIGMAAGMLGQMANQGNQNDPFQPSTLPPLPPVPTAIATSTPTPTPTVDSGQTATESSLFPALPTAAPNNMRF